MSGETDKPHQSYSLTRSLASLYALPGAPTTSQGRSISGEKIAYSHTANTGTFQAETQACEKPCGTLDVGLPKKKRTREKKAVEGSGKRIRA